MTSTRHRNIYIDGAACFWTSTGVERLPIFLSPSVCRRFLSIIDSERKKHNVKILGYVLMPEHIHLMVWSEKSADVRRFLERVLSGFSTEMAGMCQRAADKGSVKAGEWLAVFRKHARKDERVKVWKERGRAFPVTRDDTLHQKLTYIHNNPVRRRLVANAEDWFFSSASWYANGSGPLEIDEIEL